MTTSIRNFALGVQLLKVSDPGDGLAIPPNVDGFCDLVTAGAETRTLGAPVREGQILSLNLHTAVGACVITIASTVNATGNNTATFDAAGDVLTLIALRRETTLQWAVLHNDGVVLSTV